MDRELRVLSLICLPVVAWCLAWPQELQSHGTLNTTVLFDREIVRILNTHCVACHDDRALAFPLTTYEQTWLRRDASARHARAAHAPLAGGRRLRAVRERQQPHAA
jgi:hypothetical protein